MRYRDCDRSFFWMSGFPIAMVLLAGALCRGSEVQFAANRFTVNEGAAATITVTRTNGSTGTVKVDYCATPGAFDGASALPAISGGNGDFAPYVSRIRGPSVGVQYESDIAAFGTLTFLDGETVKTIPIPTRTDGIVEGDETVSLYLRNPDGAALGAIADAKLVIADADAPAAGVLQFSTPLDHAIGLPGTKTITVTRTGGGTGAVSVSYATSAIAAT
jgi:hypothetical protein